MTTPGNGDLVFKTIREVREKGLPKGDGAFMTLGDAPGMWPMMTRVAKVNSEPNDGHQDGDMATVLSSINDKGVKGYFVVWDDIPDLPCAIMAHRLRRVDEGQEGKKAVAE